MIRTIFLQIRPNFAPHPARLRPIALARCGFGFRTSNTILRRSHERRWKAFFMSPDLDKYRRLGTAEDDGCTYSDGDLLRLWAAMEHLFARSVSATCPQLLQGKGAPQASMSAPDALSCEVPPTGKEARP